ESTRQLNRGRADTARASMDEERLGRSQAAPLEDVRPDCEERFRNRCRAGEFHVTRYRQTLRCWRRAVLRIAAAGDKRTDAIARPPAVNACSHLLDGTGNLQPRNVRRTRWRRIRTPALHHVRPIDTSGSDFDQHFIGANRRAWPLCWNQYFRTAWFTNLDN